MELRGNRSAGRLTVGARFPCPRIPEVQAPVLRFSGADLLALDAGMRVRFYEIPPGTSIRAIGEPIRWPR